VGNWSILSLKRILLLSNVLLLMKKMHSFFILLFEFHKYIKKVKVLYYIFLK